MDMSSTSWRSTPRRTDTAPCCSLWRSCRSHRTSSCSLRASCRNEGRPFFRQLASCRSLGNSWGIWPWTSCYLGAFCRLRQVQSVEAHSQSPWRQLGIYCHGAHFMFPMPPSSWHTRGYCTQFRSRINTIERLLFFFDQIGRRILTLVATEVGALDSR